MGGVGAQGDGRSLWPNDPPNGRGLWNPEPSKKGQRIPINLSFEYQSTSGAQGLKVGAAGFHPPQPPIGGRRGGAEATEIERALLINLCQLKTTRKKEEQSRGRRRSCNVATAEQLVKRMNTNQRSVVPIQSAGAPRWLTRDEASLRGRQILSGDTEAISRWSVRCVCVCVRTTACGSDKV